MDAFVIACFHIVVLIDQIYCDGCNGGFLCVSWSSLFSKECYQSSSDFWISSMVLFSKFCVFYLHSFSSFYHSSFLPSFLVPYKSKRGILQFDSQLLKALKVSVASTGNELSRFSDPPGDAILDDLFHPLDKNLEERTTEASTSASTSNVNQAIVPDAGKNDLAKKLRDTIAKKQMEEEMGQSNSGRNLLHLMMDVLKDDVIDIDGLVC